MSKPKSKKRTKTEADEFVANAVEPEYEVEKILGCRWSQEKDCVEYLIKWRGYDDSVNTWERVSNLDGCRAMVAKFHRENGSKFPIPIPGREVQSHRSSKFRAEDKIDEQLLQDLGPSFSQKRWKIEKVRTGHYKLKFCGLDKGVSSAPAPQPHLDPTVADLGVGSDDEEIKDGSDVKRRRVSRRDQKTILARWIKKTNEISKAAGETVLFLENEVDDAVVPHENFVYVTSLKAGEDVALPNDPLIGCECGPKSKSCKLNSNACCAAQMNADFAYSHSGRLSLGERRPIYECNSRCTCGDDCVNRVVQKGRQIELIIFRTNDGRGWGVKTATAIKKGTFVAEYVGEVITIEAADSRSDSSYMFSMDFDGEAKYIIDAKYYGNVARFINHSCEPNLKVYSVWIEHYETSLPRLAFFTARDIDAGEELTFTYTMSISIDASDDETSADEEKIERGRKARPMVRCQCGTEMCRNYQFKRSE